MAKQLALVIEDHESIRDIYMAALEMEGYNAEGITDGKDALETLSRVSPALIILDMNLPHVSGHYLLKHIRGDERLKDVPVIISTANSILANTVASNKTENDFILVKPIEIRQLQDVVRKVKARQST